MARHSYRTQLTWTGNRGTGTSGYRDYDRSHEVSATDRPVLLGSADPTFRGDATRWNPELELLAALSQCHLMSYLHLCVTAGVVVTGYTDDAVATMEQSGIGGHFAEATLRPHVVVTSPAMVDKAIALHQDAHQACFIANSVNFPVRHEPVVTVENTQ
ncbi:MAG TPA: OsmC family protein [Pseudonocardiaceae bacterium]|jgi:organic hydroperoxide reductase OsmC/OhrA|nr:OsmC family protein [Pseudonocardiaceae bacterium]